MSNKKDEDIIRLEDKKQLRESLYYKDFDKLVIFKDGSWKGMPSDMAPQGDVAVVIYRTEARDFSHRAVDTRIKELELILNGYEKNGYGWRRRTIIRNRWNNHIKEDEKND